MRKKPPCYKCEDRYVGCHSNCDRYKNYYNKGNKNRMTDAEKDYLDYKIKSIAKYRKERSNL